MESRSKFASKILSLDVFSSSVNLQLRESKSFNTCFGTICTLLSTILCMIFLMEKIIILSSSESTLWSTYTITPTNEHNESKSFTESNGLSIAFAISSHLNVDNSANDYDEEIASFKAYYIREGYQG